MAKGIIFDIKEMSVNDGPGVRTTVFFKGCPLRCAWCHNPEGLATTPQVRETGAACTACGKCRRPCGHDDCRPHGRCLHVCPLGRLNVCGRQVDSAGLARDIRRQADILNQNGGGVTLSGGEPLLQPAFLLALMEELRPLHVAVETSAHGDRALFEAMTERADLVIVDIKHMDDAVHRQFTGVGNGLILANVQRLMSSGRPFLVRVPLIPGVTDSDDNLRNTAQFLLGAPNLVGVELMPYNTLAGAKYRSVGCEYAPDFDEGRRPNMNCAPFLERGIPCSIL